MATANTTAPSRAFKFTRTSLAAAIKAHDDAGSTGVTLRDQGMTGLIARKQKASWVMALERKVHGKVRRATLEEYDPSTFNIAKLRQDATAVLVELQAGTWQPKAEKREEQGEVARLREMKFAAVVDLLKEARPDTRENTLRAYRFAVTYMTGGKDMRIASFDTPTAQRAFNDIVTSKSGSTAMMALRSCKALWNAWAKAFPDDHKPTTDNPFKNVVTGRTKTKRRTGALPSDKRVEWMDEVRDTAIAKGPTGTSYNAILAIALTGLRLQEIAALSWDEVDLDAGTISIAGSRMKAHEPLTRPITPLVKELLLRQRDFHGSEGWVFPARTLKNGPGHITDVRKALWSVNKKVLDADDAIRPHDLRRSYIGAAEVAGVPQNIIKTLVGHAVEDVTDGYARNSGVDLLPFALKIEFYLMGME